MTKFERYLPISVQMTSIVQMSTEQSTSEGAVAELFWQSCIENGGRCEGEMPELRPNNIA